MASLLEMLGAAQAQPSGRLSRTLLDAIASTPATGSPLDSADPIERLRQSLPAYPSRTGEYASMPSGSVSPLADPATTGGMLMTQDRLRDVERHAGIASGFAGSIRAYHGSPHVVDRFDMSRIGTGEGAQTYGHGLYFAGNEGTARFYRDTLSGMPDIQIGGMSAHYRDMSRDARAALGDLALVNGDFSAARARAELLPPSSRAGYLQGLGELEASGARAVSRGHMYEVNLNTDPSRLLDWDKPLAQQPVATRIPADLMQRMGEHARRSRDEWGDIGAGTDVTGYATGQSLYHQLAGDSRNGPAATSALRSAGIDGIQYLDQGSRAAGDGSRNYVMFNDGLIDILRRYGIGGLAVGAGAGMAAEQ